MGIPCADASAVAFSSCPYHAEDYCYTVQWSEEDQLFVGRVAEFQLLAAHGDDLYAALQEIINVVGFVLRDLQERGEPVPPPFSKKTFSGKFNVRLPEQLHRELVIAAAQEGVSLNQWVHGLLARGREHHDLTSQAK